MALRSLFKCIQCGIESSFATPVCASCGGLTELPEGLSPFEVLGVPESLGVNEEVLRQKFYALSKLTHPDRHASAEPRTALLAARWSTAVNRAYQLLKDPALRAGYFLHRAGLDPAKSGVPVELAEAYFDLQDALSEPGGQQKLASFRTDLGERLLTLEAEWPGLEKAWETAGDKKKILEQVAKHLTLRRFLHSMLSDIDTKRSI